MEMTAVIEGLKRIPAGSEAIIYTDSKYVMDAFEKGWIRGWKQNGWKTAARSPVKNQDLWVELDLLVTKLKPKWNWVKGHSGIPGNERVDELATNEAKRILDKGE
jgi:ribonuclease HI